MNLQYLSDDFGNKIAVVIPINDWNKITEKYKGLQNEYDSIPEWHKSIIDKRLKSHLENPQNVTDCDTFLNQIEKENNV